MGSRKLKWIAAVGTLCLVMVIGAALVAGNRDEFAFLDSLQPRRFQDREEQGYRSYLLVFPESSRTKVRSALLRELPSRGWGLAWSGPDGELEFIRDHYRESVDFDTNPQGLSALDINMRPAGCTVDVYRHCTWAERQIYALKRWVHLN